MNFTKNVKKIQIKLIKLYMMDKRKKCFHIILHCFQREYQLILGKNMSHQFSFMEKIKKMSKKREEKEKINVRFGNKKWKARNA